MAYSNLILFKKSNTWKLYPQKLFLLDDIEAYLGSVSSGDKYIVNQFQYIKNQLEITITLDMSQVYASPTTDWAYVSISNSDTSKKYYYFVKNAEWKSSGAVKLYLVMDVLNSIKLNTDYALGEKTKINRQHKNRLVKKSIETLIPTTITFVLEQSEIYENPLDYIDSIVDSVFNGNSFSFQLLSVIVNSGDATITTDYSESLYTALINSISSNLLIKSQETPAMNILEGTLASVTINYTPVTSYHYFRKIDLISEQIPAVQYHDLTLDNLVKDPVNDSDWFLVYATTNEPTDSQVNPLNCYLVTNKNTSVQPNQPIIQGRIYPEMIQTGRYYYFLHPNLVTKYIKLADGTDIARGIDNIDTWAVFYKEGNKIIISVFQDNTTPRAIGYAPTDYLELLADISCRYKSSLTYSNSGLTSLPSQTFYLTSYPVIQLSNIDEIDRTDSKIVKIIKLPYAPWKFTYSGGNLVIPAAFEFGTFQNKNVIKLKDLNTLFENNFKSDTDNPLSILQLTTTPLYTDIRNDYFESKIYHSDYFTIKLVYDSFGFAFNLEKIDLTEYQNILDEKLSINFTPTTTINSKFLFTIPQYECGKLGTQDYNNVMPIARNNELTLYNIPYLNYIRNGYNYDIKSKNRQNISNWMGVTLGGITTLAALAFPTNPLTVPTVLGLGSSTIHSLVSAINTQAQSEQNLQAKITELQAQGASVNGADDVDLMSVYAQNRLKLVNYITSEYMRELLLDLFYYTGYTDNRISSPNLATRKWFNFCSCEAIIEPKINIAEDIQKELIGLWQSGVTVMHKVDNAYDLSQVKENAEVTIEEI